MKSHTGGGLGTPGPRMDQVVECRDLGGLSGQQAGVDEAGYGGPDGNGGDDRDPEDGAGIAGGEGAARFGDQDDAVGVEVGQRDEGGEGEVAGTADDGVA